MLRYFCKERCYFSIVLCAVLLFGLQAMATTSEGCTENVVEVVSQPLGDTRLDRAARSPTAPLAEFYSAGVWEGPLLERAERLVREHPGIKLHKNVPFKYRGEDGVETLRYKSVLEIRKTFGPAVKYKVSLGLSRGTVSFPMEEAGGHLTSRLGDKVFSWFFGWDTVLQYPDHLNSYASESFIEPVVALRASEELRLRKYVEKVKTDHQNIIGRNYYKGSGTGDTERLKNSNKPLDPARGHNCTSWICTGPIGPIDGKGTREALLSLTGAPLADEVHTNPGWWNSHLTGRANEERVPLVILWTKSDTDFAERMPAPGSGDGFRWNFDLH